MYERFNTGEQAICFVCKGLLQDFPDAEAEVLLFFNKQSRRKQCAIRELPQVLEQYCGSFPRATVDYRPQHRYGFVAEIQCHGETNPKRDTGFKHRRNDFVRPRVVVLLKRVHNEDVLIGDTKAPQDPGLYQTLSSSR